jgi:2-polyprenyl-3-methyl-5-hydroxy-6-metoxy-1,4-benzoquinol methylase
MVEPDIPTLAKIIQDIGETEDIFYKRMFGKQRHTMYFKFWSKHFEYLDLLESFPEISGHMVDFGCGSGHPDICLAFKGRKVHGIDNSETAIAIANYLKGLQPHEIQDNTSFECLYLDETVEEAEYDSAWSSHCFEHIEDPTDAFEGLKRLTKPAAKMLISVPFKTHYNHPTHVHWWYSEKEFEDYLSKWVKVLEVKRKNTVLRALLEL